MPPEPVALHKRDGALGFLAGLAVRLGADDLVGVHDKAAMLALRTEALSSLACLKVIQIGAAYPFSIAADHNIKTLMP
jgi:hypothetical protein